MATPKLLGVDLTSQTFAWKTSAGADNDNSTYPTSNLKDGYPDTLSKSNSAGSDQYLLIDNGVAVSCNAIAIDGQNFVEVDPDTAILLQYNTNDDTNWADAVTALNIQVSGGYSNEALFSTFNAVSKRYWRILFASTCAVAPQFGNVFLGTALEFEDPAENPSIQAMPSHETVVEMVSLDGRSRSAATAGGRLNWEMEFKLQSDTFAAAWIAFLLTVSNNLMPFYFTDFNGDVWCVKFGNNYNPMQKRRYNQNDVVRFPMKTVLANY